MRNHRNEVAPQLPEFFFSSQRPKQFSFRLLAVGNIETDDQHVRFAVDLDNIGGLNDCVDGPQRSPKLAFDLSDGAVALKIGQKLRTIVEIHPYAELLGVTPKKILPAETKPPNKGVVRLDELLVTQAHDGDVHRAGVEGLAEAFLAFPQQMLRQRPTRFFQRQ